MTKKRPSSRLAKLEDTVGHLSKRVGNVESEHIALRAELRRRDKAIMRELKQLVQGLGDLAFFRKVADALLSHFPAKDAHPGAPTDLDNLAASVAMEKKKA